MSNNHDHIHTASCHPQSSTHHLHSRHVTPRPRLAVDDRPRKHRAEHDGPVCRTTARSRITAQTVEDANASRPFKAIFKKKILLLLRSLSLASGHCSLQKLLFSNSKPLLVRDPMDLGKGEGGSQEVLTAELLPITRVGRDGGTNRTPMAPPKINLATGAWERKSWTCCSCACHCPAQVLPQV